MKKIPSLDLHGVRQEEVFDLLDKFIRKEEAKGSSAVRIIHGIGTGKVKARVLEFCKITGHQPKPDKGENGQVNPGSVLLYL
jgi:dsDNA-specific endonuclease/ATPase MutS2